MRRDLLRDLYLKDDGMPKSLRDLLHRDEIDLEDSWSVLNSIFLPKVTERNGGEDGQERGTYTENLEDAKDGWMHPGCGTLRVNTDPFGVQTGNTFPEFIGVCAGDRTLVNALKAVMQYCKKAKKEIPQLAKTVIFLTDRWDAGKFRRRFELPFLHYALRYNVLFVFLLVTDYGVTRIPFLARNHYELEDIRQKNYDIEREHPGVVVMDALKTYDPCTYECHSGTWAPYGSSSFFDLRYWFDFRAMRCEIQDSGKETLIKKIPKAGAQRFAEKVYEFHDARCGTYADSAPVVDAGTFRAKLFGIQFTWHIAEQDPFKKVSGAFNELISSLEEL